MVVVAYETHGRRSMTHRWSLGLALALLCALYVPGLAGLFPLDHDLDRYVPAGDDWFVYHRFALDIRDHGLSLPGLEAPYSRPAGFAYPYFIALVYAIFGVSSEAVYLVQGCLLVGSILLLFATFRHQLSPAAGLFLLVALTACLYVDVFRSLTFRLLSENLLFPATALLLFFMVRGESSGRLGWFAAAGAACGLCYIARPNAVLYAPAAIAAILIAMRQRPLAWRIRSAAVFLAIFALVGLSVGVRNYVAVGSAEVTSLVWRGDWWVPGRRAARLGLPMHEQARTAIVELSRKAAFLLGFPQWAEPAFRTRPHWLIIWAGVAIRLWQLRRGPVLAWEFLVVALCASYAVPLFLFGNPTSYGIRMVTPVLPVALILLARAVDTFGFSPQRRG
jgi:4-amino-4-deoxy-L-arabinose transferase-like glycosyltransferase